MNKNDELSINKGRLQKNIEFAGVGKPKKSDDFDSLILNFANLNAAPNGIRNDINAIGAIEKITS
tara:strand:+ start:532 stop:726 length:195 start_codon:yes stop_codon:yes gene_type:complete